MTEAEVFKSERAPIWKSIVLASFAVFLMGYLRFVYFPDRIIHLSYGIALLVCLYIKDKRVLWGMTSIFSIMAVLKLYYFIPTNIDRDEFNFTTLMMQLANIWIVSTTIHMVINSRTRLKSKAIQLELMNQELQAMNEELSAREEEISQQNEELQAQTEELEQQTEELRQQSEELEAQSEELQTSNSLLGRRENALNLLLETTRWMGGSGRQEILRLICKACVEAMEGLAIASALVERKDDRLSVKGHYGFGDEGPAKEQGTFQQSLAAIVFERKKTAYIKDVALRPDMQILKPGKGEDFKSVLAAPIFIGGEVAGVLEIFSSASIDWTAENFRMLEWLALQASFIIEAMQNREEIDRRSKEAEESSRRKTRFLAAVSHDVRTPANSISIIADTIARVAKDPLRREKIPEYAMNLKKSAKSLVELVGDVLDLARFDSGRLDLVEHEFSLGEMIDAEFRNHHAVAENKGINLRIEPMKEELIIRSDRVKLTRVLGNIIGNAVKFTERGEVAVKLDLHSSGAASISVVDTGAGIPSEHLDSVFDEFFQLKNPERDRNKGTGLGLAICKRLVDSLDFKLEVQSEIGKGSTFKVIIPAKYVTRIGKASEKSTETEYSEGADLGQRLKGLKILLVEDHQITRLAMTEVLESEGAIVTSAENGKEALLTLVHEIPRVILLDLMLPDMDGSDVLKNIFERPVMGLEAVFVITGDVSQKRIDEVLALGANGLISKPLEPEALINTLIPFAGMLYKNVIELRQRSAP